MATIVIGDVHGNSAALDDLLGQVRSAITDGDAIVFLGDYIDRGANSKECVDAIISLQQEVNAEVVCLCGNHEDWFIRTLRDYHRHSWLLGMEGFDTIRSYSPEAAHTLRKAAAEAGLELYQGHCRLPYEIFFDCLPQAHVRFFESLRVSYQSPDGFCSHGGLDPQVSRIQDQTRHALIWGAGGFPDRYNGSETVVYGHWDNAALDADGWPAPKIVGRTIGLDTIAHGVLTAVRLPDQRLFQSARHTV
jgi:serine/threonine protein phosphatase 1